MDKPRISRSYSSIQKGKVGVEVVNSIWAQVTIRSETYKTYVEIRNKAGFGDDDGFINHLLIASYYRTQGRKMPGSPADAKKDSVQTAHKDSSAGSDVPELNTFDKSVDTMVDGAEKRESHEQVDVKETTEDQEMAEVVNQDTAEAKVAEIKGLLENVKVGVAAGPIPCPKCKANMSSEEELTEHLKNCDILAKYKNRKAPKVPRFIYCNWCGMRFTDTVNYKKHYERYHLNHGPFYTCGHCDKKQAFTDKRGLIEHQQGDPVCGLCQRRYSKLDTLKLHMQNKNHDKNRKNEQSLKKAKCNKVHVPAVTEAVNNAEPTNLPHGFSFMSVRLNPLHRLPDGEERLLYVPETAYREGYTLQADFTATPFPEPIDECEEDC